MGSGDESSARYAQHPGVPRRRAEERLPAEAQPRFSESDVDRIVARALRGQVEYRDSEPTGVTELPRNDPDVTKIRPRLHFTARVIAVLAVLCVAGSVVWAAGLGLGTVADDRTVQVLERRGVLCPEKAAESGACKSVPDRVQQMDERLRGIESTIDQVNGKLDRLLGEVTR